MWNFILGYARITIKGIKLSALLTQAAREGISLYRVRGFSFDCVEGECALRRLRELQSLCDRRGAQLIRGRVMGLPAVLSYIGRHWGFASGAALVCAAVCILSLFCLSVTVCGPAGESLRASVAESLTQMGAVPGVYKAALNIPALRASLMRDNPDASIITLRFKGTALCAEVVQKVPISEVYDANAIADIVAGKDAVILRTDVYAGTALVAQGQAVRAGDTLVAARVTLKDETVRLIRARADIWARVTYEGLSCVPAVNVTPEESGSSIRRSYIALGALTLMRDTGGIPYEYYRLSTRSYALCAVRGVRYVTEVYTELKAHSAEAVLAAAMREAYAKARLSAYAGVSADAVVLAERKEFYLDESNLLCARVYIDTRENIALTRALTGEE